MVNPERLDHEREDGRNFELKILAMQAGNVLSSADVSVLVRDSNDNVPIFDQEGYIFSVREDAQNGESIGKH